MKRKVLFFVLVILLCFCFTSCDEFGLKTIEGDVYLWLPVSDEVELVGTLGDYKFELIKKIIPQERKKELQEEYPQISIFEEKKDIELYDFFLCIHFGESRKDFVIDLTLKTDGDKYSGKIEIPYLMDEGGICNVELINEDNEKFDGIFVYKFWRTI